MKKNLEFFITKIKIRKAWRRIFAANYKGAHKEDRKQCDELLKEFISALGIE
jgi:hypothetical protein